MVIDNDLVEIPLGISSKLYHIIFLFVLVLLVSACASSPIDTHSSLTPLWVTDLNKAFPDNAWLRVVERGTDKSAVENAAITKLGQTFHIDIRSFSLLNHQMYERISGADGKSVAIFDDSLDITQIVELNSAIDGLIGLRVESWTNPRDNVIYSVAYMNREEGVFRYTEAIRKNERIIAQLIDEARLHIGTIKAAQMLNLAYELAESTDNLNTILGVLSLSSLKQSLSYDNAQAIKVLLQDALREIIIAINVTGDANNRVLRAFTETINTKGIRTVQAGEGNYALDASLKIEDLDSNNSQFQFVRYTLEFSLVDSNRVELFSRSINGRAGHLNISEARNKAIQVAETTIRTTGFAESFKSFLESL